MLLQAQAEVHSPHTPRRLSAEKRARKLEKTQARFLHLTGRQQQRMTAINNDQARKIDAIRMAKGMDRNTRVEKIKALKEERNNRYKEVLTADQYKKWNDYEMKKKQMRKDLRDQNRTGKLEKKLTKRENKYPESSN